jgi:SagB-type dehydrogenase family enzyme
MADQQTRSYRLSRFAYMTASDGRLVMTSAATGASYPLGEPEMHVVEALVESRTLSQLESLLGRLDPIDVRTVLRELEANGMLADRDESPNWSFHDRLLSSTRSHVAVFSPPAAVCADPAPMSEPGAVFEALLVDVDDRRRSVRSWAPTMTSEQLIRFLRWTAGSQAPLPGITRPFTVWVVVGRCDGLDSGLYRCQVGDDHLALVAGATPGLAEMLHDAAMSVEADQVPPVLLCITAPAPRPTSYSLLLHQVGALFHRFYLVATALELGPCAVGNGNSDLFAIESGADYFDEPLVGEFVLGARGTA